jgi:acid phosphatase family membrane protein YuiD
MASPAADTPARLSLSQVLPCGAAVVTPSMGIRHGFGLFLQPLTMDRGWSRETFAFAFAFAIVVQHDVAWWIAVALGVFAAVVNWPVRETPIVRPVPQPE